MSAPPDGGGLHRRSPPYGEGEIPGPPRLAAIYRDLANPNPPPEKIMRDGDNPLR